MKSNARSRARARLATSKPVNVMFSNGLGVCKYGNAGSKSICLNKTGKISTAKAFLTVLTKDITITDETQHITMKFSTNVELATVSLIDSTAKFILMSPTTTGTINGSSRTYTAVIDPPLAGFNASTDLILRLTGGRVAQSFRPNAQIEDTFKIIDNVPITLQVTEFLTENGVNNKGVFFNQNSKATEFKVKSNKNGSLSKSGGVLQEVGGTTTGGTMGFTITAGGAGVNVTGGVEATIELNAAPDGVYSILSFTVTDPNTGTTDTKVVAESQAGAAGSGALLAENYAQGVPGSAGEECAFLIQTAGAANMTKATFLGAGSISCANGSNTIVIEWIDTTNPPGMPAPEGPQISPPVFGAFSNAGGQLDLIFVIAGTASGGGAAEAIKLATTTNAVRFVAPTSPYNTNATIEIDFTTTNSRTANTNDVFTAYLDFQAVGTVLNDQAGNTLPDVGGAADLLSVTV